LAIQTVNEIHDGRDYDSDTSPNTRLTRQWRIIAESGDDPVDVINDASLPAQKGDAHPSEPRALVQRIELRQEDPDDFDWVWLYRAEYSTAIAGPPGGEEENENPLVDQIAIEWSYEARYAPLNVALDPTDRTTRIPVANSAGQEFDPSVNTLRMVRTLTIQKNLNSFDQNYFDYGFVERVNSATFYGYQPGEVLLEGVAASLQYRGLTPYWRATFRFLISPTNEGWVVSLQDTGVYQYIDDELERITDKKGNDVVLPVPLDGNGRALHEVLGRKPTREEIVYLDFWPYYEANFSTLGLGG